MTHFFLEIQIIVIKLSFVVPFLVKNAGVAPTEATTYMATFNSMHYLCGAGFGSEFDFSHLS